MSSGKRKTPCDGSVKSKKRTVLHYFSVSQRSDNNNDGTIDDSTTQSDGASVKNTEQSDIEITEYKPVDQTESSTSGRVFQSKWFSLFSWVTFNEEKNVMQCSLCLKHRKVNTLTEGTSNFRTSTLTRHADGKDHKAAVLAENMKSDFVTAIKNVTNEKENALSVAMRSVYWLAKENLPLHKHSSLMEFLKINDCPNIDKLSQGHVTYTSDSTANDMLETLASSIRGNINMMLTKSPFISIFADESTDIGMQKKLVVYARVLDPDTYKPSTHFIENVKIANGTGKAVAEALISCLEERDVPMSKVMGLGSDGAKVMTGKKEGVTGYLMRKNPMMLNFHCIAHRLALVSSQAASDVPYIKEFQETLTGMFYFFKASANRCEKLASIQSLLEEPTLKVREIHEVRWMSIYKAVESVYRTLDSLITLFANEKDAKAKGYSRKLANHKFIATTYMLMDILPIITEMCLVFQKTDLDVAMVQVSVDNCIATLEKYKNGDTLQNTYLGQLKEHLIETDGKMYFKGHLITKTPQDVNKNRVQFIESLIAKLNDRFPKKDSNIMYAYGVLGLRPISFLSKSDLEAWGNEKIEVLCTHFGTTQQHGEGETDPIIDTEKTKQEWNQLKPLVLNSGYPRDKLSVLWSLINSYHKDDFPNLLTLAGLALTAPIHTADCERGFSGQNRIKTSYRNRIKPSTVDDLLTVSLEGLPVKEFNFSESVKIWKAKKQRKIFS
ncbi:zinc finger protein 862-like [Pecten maximus]|uniref:zinc finger protein 862-like n=1 Tax=Pecten maximus TaxID=6579 RepID=UPI0014588E6C|nr:zinc finger protein 862-like [Pecten maximus]